MKTPFGPLNVFVAIARHHNMRAAAHALRLQPSTVSHQLKVLEERCSARLISRSTRHLELTEEGRALYARVMPAIEEIETAFEEVRQSEVRNRGRIRASVPEFAWNLIFKDRIGDFHARHPGIELEWSVSDRMVDLDVDTVDVGVRLGDRLDESRIAVPITRDLPCGLIASPEYLRQHGTPKTAAELFRHQTIRYRFPGSGKLAPWELQSLDGLQQVETRPAFVVDSIDAVVDLAVGGNGIGYTFIDYVEHQLEAGELVELMPQSRKIFPPLYLYYPVERRGSESIRAYVQHFSMIGEELLT